MSDLNPAGLNPNQNPPNNQQLNSNQVNPNFGPSEPPNQAQNPTPSTPNPQTEQNFAPNNPPQTQTSNPIPPAQPNLVNPATPNPAPVQTSPLPGQNLQPNLNNPAPTPNQNTPSEPLGPQNAPNPPPLQQDPTTTNLNNPVSPAQTNPPQPNYPPQQDFNPAPTPSPNSSEQIPTQQNNTEIIQGAPIKPGDKLEDSNLPPKYQSQNQAKNNPPANTNFLKNKKPNGAPLDGEEKIFAGIGYISFLALLPLLARRDSEFCQHHGRQGLILFIIFFFFFIIASFSLTLKILAFILQIVVVVGGFLLAYRGEWFKIPLIYELSLKLKFPQVKQK